MGSVMQSFSTDTIQVVLECSEVAGKVCHQFDIFRRGLRVVCFFRRDVERERENSYLFKRLHVIVSIAENKFGSRLLSRTLRV